MKRDWKKVVIASVVVAIYGFIVGATAIFTGAATIQKMMQVQTIPVIVSILIGIGVYGIVGCLMALLLKKPFFALIQKILGD